MVSAKMIQPCAQRRAPPAYRHNYLTVSIDRNIQSNFEILIAYAL